MSTHLEQSSMPELDLIRVKQELASKSLIDFIKLTKPEYDPQWYHILLCDKLEKVYAGTINKLIVTMPPQRGKSQILSRHFPAWVLGKDPTHKIVGASYSPDLASSFNRDTQRIIDTPEYAELFPKTQLNSSNVVTVSKNWLRNSGIFEIVNHGGFYKSVGIGQALTGSPMDLGLADDLVKDSVEAESYTYRERVWRWLMDVFFPRMHGKARAVLCMTRWHDDDAIGRLLKGVNSGDWELLNIPAIKENDSNHEDPRQIGEGLWEERFPIETVRKVQKESPRTFAALYQQNPRPVQVGGEVYYGFKTDKHISDVKYNPALPLHIMWDFNRLPYTTCLIKQIEVVDGITEVRYIDELCLPDPARTKGTAQRFLQKYFHSLGHKSGLYVYGDPSGRQEDSKTEKGENNYKLITNELAIMHPQLRVANAAPSVDMRINWINDILENNYGNIKIMISPRCSYFINDMQYIKINPKGGKLKEKGIIPGIETPCEIYGHTSDAFEYGMCEVFKTEYERFQRGGAKTEIMYQKKERKW